MACALRAGTDFAANSTIERSMKVAGGTMVDATFIPAPSSTKNADQSRDPEIHQTRKGNQWYFGMKVHIGADTQNGFDLQRHHSGRPQSDAQKLKNRRKSAMRGSC